MAVVGIDIGATGSKCCVYSENGRLLAEAYESYQGKSGAGIYEVEAAQVWEGTKCAVRRAINRISDIQAIALTSFGESFVLLDEADRPLTSFMLYSDNRGAEESLELQREFGAKAFSQLMGIKPSSMMSAPKLMWVKKHYPDLFAQTKRVLFGADYIIYCLCGAFVTDYTLAARTAMFDVHKMDWNEKVLKFVGVSRDQLPRPLPTGSIVGRIGRKIARELELPEHVAIVTGCHDQVASAIGTGILKPGMAIDSVGSLECITSFYNGCPEYLALYQGGYAIVPYVLPGAYVTYAFSLTGGSLLRWCREHIGKKEQETAQRQGKSFYQYLDETMADMPTDLLVLPHFTGAGTPYMDSESRGAIVGLTTETKLEEIYRAMMEGSTYEMRYNLERLSEGGLHVKELRATGGGSQSAQWLQIKADILNIPITSQGDYRAGGIGCAMMAGKAAGLFSSLEEAAEVFVKQGRTYEPRQHVQEQYNRNYERYQNLYQAVKMVL